MPDCYGFGPFLFYHDDGRLDLVENAKSRRGAVILRPRERAVLWVLVKARTRHSGFVSKKTILDEVWGNEETNVADGSLYTEIKNLRAVLRALAVESCEAQWIECKTNTGYRLATEVRQVVDEKECSTPRASERHLSTLENTSEALSGHYQNVRSVGGTETLPTRCDLLVRRSRAELAAGRRDVACQCAREAMSLAEEAGDRLAFPRAVEVFGETARLLGKVNEESVAFYKLALKGLRGRVCIESARLLVGYAKELALGSQHRDAARLAQRAFDLARELGHRKTMVEALSVATNVMGTARRLQRQLALTDELVGATESDYADLTAELRSLRLQLFVALGDRSAAEREFEVRESVLAQTQSNRPAYIHRLQRAFFSFLDGEIERGKGLAGEAAVFGEPTQGSYAPQMLGIQLTYAEWLQDNLDQVALLLEAAILQHPQPAWRCGLAFIRSYQRKAREARRHIERVAGGGFARLPRDVNWLPAMALLAEAYYRLGDGRGAGGMYEALRPFASTHVILGPVAVCYGSVCRHLGFLAGMLGRWPAAEKHFANALRANEQQGNRPMVALTYLQYAEIAHRFGRAAVAEEAVESALDFAAKPRLALIEREAHALKSSLQAQRCKQPEAL